MHRARQGGWDFIVLSFHTNHVLQPFDVTYFISFKTTFVTYKDVWTLINKGKVLERRIGTTDVFGLKKTLNQHNICKALR